MIIKKLNISFYKKIKKLISKNGFQIPNYYFWIRLWKNNINKKIGDGIIVKNQLVGYHSYFEKILVFKKKKYKILVSSNWNVDIKYRNYSIFLINNFFKKKSPIFLTTTANFKVSEIWKSFGAYEINKEGTRNIYFKIHNNKDVVELYLRKNKQYIFSVFKQVLIFYLFFLSKLKKANKNETKLLYKFNNYVDKEIKDFNIKYEKNSQYPMEKRSFNEITNYINIIKHNKEIFIVKIYMHKNIIGYSVLAKEKIKNTNIHRMYLAEIRIKKTFEKYIDQIFEYFSDFSKNKNCSLIEFRNLNYKILRKLNKTKYFIRRIENAPYLIKFGSSLNTKLQNQIKKNLETSFLDGDCLL